MLRRTRTLLCARLLVTALVAAACSDNSGQIVAPDGTDTGPSVSARWNQRAVALVVARQPTSNGQAAVSRILTYVSIAQYRAVVAAQSSAGAPKRPSTAAAVSSASAAVLNSLGVVRED